MTVAATLLRWLALAGAAASAAVFGAAPAGAVPILEAADAAELAQALAEARDDQDVCYGWSVDVTDYAGGADGLDQGSSLGVGPTPIETDCRRYVIFEAFITYTSNASESEDSAYFNVRSNVPLAPTATDLRRCGISEGGLLGENDDQTVANATLLLPALMAEAGLAPPMVLEANTQPLPSGDRATGTPGSDWLRKYGAIAGMAALVFAGGVGWSGWILFRERPFRRRPVLVEEEEQQWTSWMTWPSMSWRAWPTGRSGSCSWPSGTEPSTC
ncbi:MAG TPA: hypothetical protein VHA34_16560 [Actinomycetes bacterium]|nr:hypothetical protein [Actinomycetes bacterium]